MQTIHIESLGERRRPSQHLPSMIGIIPIEIGIANGAACRGLPDLPRARNKSHLPIFLDMILQNRCI